MRRAYSTGERADALAHLAAEAGSVKRAARAAGVPRKTLEYWARGRGLNAEVLSMIEESRKKLAATLMREAEEMAAELPGKRPGASYQQALVGIGIAVDKSQLLSGEPTAINAQRGARQGVAEAVETLLAEARKVDPAVTAEQVRAELAEQLPEIAGLLKAAPEP